MMVLKRIVINLSDDRIDNYIEKRNVMFDILKNTKKELNSVELSHKMKKRMTSDISIQTLESTVPHMLNRYDDKNIVNVKKIQKSQYYVEYRVKLNPQLKNRKNPEEGFNR